MFVVVLLVIMISLRAEFDAFIRMICQKKEVL